MTETRRMHYVPKVYLEKFAKQRGDEFYICALEKQSGKIFSPKTKNICVETDLYLLEGATENERQMIENLYNELFEKEYNKIHKILVDDSRDSITMEERYEIISFVVSMFYRNNIWNARYNKLIDETLEKAYLLSRANEIDSFFFGEQEVSIVGKSLEDLQKENRTKDRQMIALTAVQRIFELTRMRVVNDVVTIVKTEDLIVTSDNPVSFRGENLSVRPILIDPNNTLTLPIDDCHLLQLRPWGDKLNNNLTMLGRMSEFSIVSGVVAETNNQFQYNQAERFILGTEEGIKGFQHDPTGELFKKKMQAKFATRMTKPQ
ncbi:DUF4238 domain-containing protein [Sediminibacterium salmoneum]|uniref:DUF4238 domain-containing protein n=1 Tax=Sediminibacterium salmoneum TaxID=426421 RepID=UPI00047CD663|nr:DUF4238 domain-containing protein [Sediminibacterium salmoneum]